MANIIAILKEMDSRSLVLLDELGSGTDPTEGMGLAIALLEDIKGSGCLLTATTHYPEIKDFAAKTAGFCNARMAFDQDTLMPLYRLEIGLAGESCALHIAERLGLPKRIVERAYIAAYDSGKSYAGANGTGRSRISPEENSNMEESGNNDKDCEANKDGNNGDNDNNNVKPGLPENDSSLDVSGGTLEINTEYSSLFKLPEADDAESEPAQKAPVCSLKPGDSIRIRASGKVGIVYAPIDDKGNVGVQVQDRKFFINHKRIRLLTPAEELYPDYPNYDLSIVLDTVANRKAHHRMEKGHFEGNMILTEKEQQ
jgi:dsDNA-specific endonuclease/ATPase MutS2